MVNVLLLKFDTSSKKEIKMIKAHFFDEKQQQQQKQQKCLEIIYKYQIALFMWTCPTDPWYNIFQYIL